MKLKLTYFIIFLLFSFNYNYSQSTEIDGKIVRIKYTDSTVNLADTICSWAEKTTNSGKRYSYYLSTVVFNNFEYLIGTKGYNDYTPINWSSNSRTILNVENNADSSIHHFLGDSFVHVIYSYSDVPYIKRLSQGIWLLYDYYGNNFLDSNGTIYTKLPGEDEYFIAYILGRVNDIYLNAVLSSSSSEIEFYLNDLTTSPSIDFSNSPNVEFVGFPIDYKPGKLMQLNDDLYLCQSVGWRNDQIDLIQFQDSTFNYIKSYSYNNITQWDAKNDNIYICYQLADYSYCISKMDFNYSDSTLVNEKIIYSPKTHFQSNNEFEFVAHILTDTLYLFNILEEKIQNQWDISDLSLKHSIIVGDDEIFVHHITNITDIKEKDEAQVIEFELKQNYPNPFNPTTTIKYSIPINVGTSSALSLQTSLIVYDVLGNEIRTLVNERQPAGNYKVEFNGKDLPSGVYFYRLTYGTRSTTDKMLLLK